MIPSNPNPPMKHDEVRSFHMEMARRISGEFTSQEREQAECRQKVYETVIKQNGGKNPLFGF